MIRWIATIAAGVVLAAALAWRPADAQAAPQSVPAPAAQPPWEQPPSPDTPDAISPVTPNRKPHGGARAASSVNLMRGGDTASLIAQLPWWRDASHPPGSDPGELESPILTACDVWLGFPFATGDAQSLTVRLSAAQHAGEIELVTNKIRVADAGEVNEIDLAAPPDEPQGQPWLLRGLLALLGGALAAFSAVRYLVA